MNAFQERLNWSKTKTRIAVIDPKLILKPLILHLFKQNNIDFNLWTDELGDFDEQKDFVLFFFNEIPHKINPNISLFIQDFIQDEAECQDYINSITAGGIFIFDEDNGILSQLTQDSDAYFRKLPYSKNTNLQAIDTEFGMLELNHLNSHAIQHLEAVRLLCQQVGLLGEGFYEGLLSFSE